MIEPLSDQANQATKREVNRAFDETGRDQAPSPPQLARSGGPKTEAGKRKVSQNATKHGITSPSPVAGGEKLADWEEFRQGWRDYFRPVGMPEADLVDLMATTVWRKRRIIRRENALINAQYERINEGLELAPSVPPMRIEERVFDAKGHNLDAAVQLLEHLDELESDSTLDISLALGVIALLTFDGLELPEDLRDEQVFEGLGSVGGLRAWIKSRVQATESSYEDVLQSALQRGRDVQANRARRQSALARTRVLREGTAAMPGVHDMDALVRHEAHLDRSFARALSQLELLQRLRSGQDVPPAERVEVTVH